MSVGIYDADMATYGLVPFNLEAMKLSTYYKNQNEIVVLAQGFTPERHTHFVYRKDYDDEVYPEGLNRSNVTYGGLAFSGGLYLPMEEAIEKCPPDTELYEKARPYFVSYEGYTEPIKKQLFSNMRKGEHCRLSLDGKTVWPSYESQIRDISHAPLLLIHDNDLNAVKGGFDVVSDLVKSGKSGKNPMKIGMKFPVQIYDLEGLQKWTSFKAPHSVLYSLQFNGTMDTETFNEWLDRCCAERAYSKLYYNITPAGAFESNLIEALPRIFRQIVISRSYRVFFSLVYDENFFSNRQWCEVLKLMNGFAHYWQGERQDYFYNKNETTCYEYAANKIKSAWYEGERQEREMREWVRDVFGFVRENCYPLFKEFYECTAEKLGGRLHDD